MCYGKSEGNFPSPIKDKSEEKVKEQTPAKGVASVPAGSSATPTDDAGKGQVVTPSPRV